jgi:hypothetical protein
LELAIDEFKSYIVFVQATLPKFPWSGDPNSAATIWQIKDDNYGLIEVKGGPLESPYRFFVLFHKDQVSKSSFFGLMILFFVGD